MDFYLDVPWLSNFWLIAATFTVVIIGSVVQFGMGMGFGMVAAPLLALIDPTLVPISAIFLGVLTSLGVVIEDRRNIRWNEVSLYLSGRFVGVLIASFLLSKLTNQKSFILIFGILTLIAILISLIGFKFKFNKRNIHIVGQVSGFMGTLTAVSAPPVAILYQDHKLNESRATMAAFFLTGGFLSLIGIYWSGWAGLSETLSAALLVFPMVIGIFLAKKLKKFFISQFRFGLLALSGISAICLILRGIS